MRRLYSCLDGRATSQRGARAARADPDDRRSAATRFPAGSSCSRRTSDELGPDDREEAARDAVTAAIADQVRAGLDVITDGEQTRFDFNLSFYAFLDGLELEHAAAPALGPAGARPARPPPHRRRAARAARARRGRGVRAAARARAAGPMLKASGARPVHARRPDRAERRLPGPLRRDRGARPDRARRARAPRRRRLRDLSPSTSRR